MSEIDSKWYQCSSLVLTFHVIYRNFRVVVGLLPSLGSPRGRRGRLALDLGPDGLAQIQSLQLVLKQMPNETPKAKKSGNWAASTIDRFLC